MKLFFSRNNVICSSSYFDILSRRFSLWRILEGQKRHLQIWTQPKHKNLLLVYSLYNIDASEVTPFQLTHPTRIMPHSDINIAQLQCIRRLNLVKGFLESSDQHDHQWWSFMSQLSNIRLTRPTMLASFWYFIAGKRHIQKKIIFEIILKNENCI